MGIPNDGNQKIRKMLQAEQRKDMDPYDIAYEAVVKVLGTYAPTITEVPVPVVLKGSWADYEPLRGQEIYLGWIITQHAKVMSRLLVPRPNAEAVLQVLVDMVRDATK